MIVVKVGGSLFDHPALGPGLRDFVASLHPAEVLLVSGGGPVADVVRELDRVHGLGEEAAHWVALRALGVTAAMLRSLLLAPTTLAFSEPTPQPPPCREGEKEGVSEIGRKSGTPTSFSPSLQGGGWGVGSSVHVLDCFAFAQEDDSRPGALPHSWCVTTDSIAARAASVFDAEKLILLKSVDIPPGTSWEIAAANGWVDAHFPHVAATLVCHIETINFRLFGK